LKIKKGDLFISESANDPDPTIWLYCGKLNTSSSANKILYNVSFSKAKRATKINRYARASKYTLEDKKIKIIKNVGEDKAEKYLNYFQEYFDEHFYYNGFLKRNVEG
jgi:hypothetical protein